MLQTLIQLELKWAQFHIHCKCYRAARRSLYAAWDLADEANSPLPLKIKIFEAVAALGGASIRLQVVQS